MASVSTKRARKGSDYPTSDGRPMAETDWHRDLMYDLIGTLKFRYVRHPRVYVSGTLLLFYIPGDRLRHLAPDVFVVKGVPKHDRPNYLIWEEGKGPDVVFELTSSSTREEDITDKFHLYQDTLKVREYFLFDPLGDYLDPPLRGYRLLRGRYQPIRPVNGRLPSRVLDLHLERNGRELRLHDPATGLWLPTPTERAEQADRARERAEQAEAAWRKAETDNERLRHELEQLRRSSSQSP